MDTVALELSQKAGLEASRHETASDPVNAPPHYQGFGGVECIDAMRSMMPQPELVGFLRGNTFKYLWRYPDKNGVEDLKKARWYLDQLIAEMGRGA